MAQYPAEGLWHQGLKLLATAPPEASVLVKRCFVTTGGGLLVRHYLLTSTSDGWFERRTFDTGASGRPVRFAYRVVHTFASIPEEMV